MWLHHVQITIPRGQERVARDFYCGVLGMREIAKPESLRERGGLWLSVGDRQVHIGTEEGIERSASKAHVAYEVSDLSGLRSSLAKAGFVVTAQIPITGYDRFEIRDPFGNRVEFLQRLET
jgi:catechol 2,3-dioxygenase-like lactoylglutathione lyase family enzyme